MEKTLVSLTALLQKFISKDLSAKDLLPYNWPTDKKIKKAKFQKFF